MTDKRRTNQTNDPQRPSQAEGDRETVEQDLNEQSQKRRKPEAPASAGERENDPPRPSQAEGERDVADKVG